MFNKFPKRTGIYHVRDNIECLELEIYFRQINSLLKLPKFDINRILDNNQRKYEAAAGVEQEDATADNVRVVRVKWQEKFFSAREVEFYQKIENCLTETQKKYHKCLLEQEEENMETGEAAASRRAKVRKRNKKRQKSMEVQEKEQQHKLMQADGKSHEIFTYIQEDNFDPDEKRVKHKSTAGDECSTIKTMYIYAALKPDTQLIALKWYPQQRMLHIYPDFNSTYDHMYYIEIDSDYRHLYAYGFSNISKTKKLEALKTTAAHFNAILPELRLSTTPTTTVLPTHWQAESERSAEFQMPPKRCRRISLLFEISKAENFEYNTNLHVRYHINLPPNTILEEGVLNASTHASTASANGRRCHFGYNWQLTLLCEEHFNPSDMLHLYFEIISIDSWERERVEGYGYYATYLNAGCDHIQLQCLRPADSFIAALNRYFIGGRQLFDFRRFFTAPKESQFHSRYGMSMLSTGQLYISCQRFTQSNCELLQPCISTIGMTLDDIMLAYRDARKRLEAIMVGTPKPI